MKGGLFKSRSIQVDVLYELHLLPSKNREAYQGLNVYIQENVFSLLIYFFSIFFRSVMQSTKEEYHFARAFSPQKQDEAEEALLQHQKRLLNATLGVSMRNTVGYDDLILCLLTRRVYYFQRMCSNSKLFVKVFNCMVNVSCFDPYLPNSGPS